MDSEEEKILRWLNAIYAEANRPFSQITHDLEAAEEDARHSVAYFYYDEAAQREDRTHNTKPDRTYN